MIHVKDLRMGTRVEVRVLDRDLDRDTWEPATVSNGNRVRWRGEDWTFSAVDVRMPGECKCGDCVACEFREARERRQRRSA